MKEFISQAQNNKKTKHKKHTKVTAATSLKKKTTAKQQQ